MILPHETLASRHAAVQPREAFVQRHRTCTTVIVLFFLFCIVLFIMFFFCVSFSFFLLFKCVFFIYLCFICFLSFFLLFRFFVLLVFLPVNKSEFNAAVKVQMQPENNSPKIKKEQQQQKRHSIKQVRCSTCKTVFLIPVEPAKLYFPCR